MKPLIYISVNMVINGIILSDDAKINEKRA